MMIYADGDTDLPAEINTRGAQVLGMEITRQDREMRIRELGDLYAPVRPKIESRLLEFQRIWETATDEELFRELAFCLLTPQSRAKTCWAAVERLVEGDLLKEGCEDEIRGELVGIRFSYRKAEYICKAREMFQKISLRDLLSGFSTPEKAREWLVTNVLGMGYKEAGHFLRNIGRSGDLAILDRHILKNIDLLGVIEEVPKSLTKKKYLEIESRMKAFSKEIGIPMDHLDLLLWYKEAGEVFK